MELIKIIITTAAITGANSENELGDTELRVPTEVSRELLTSDLKYQFDIRSRDVPPPFQKG